ncbi:hypothetical protein DID75_05055 [Candidatus Marinamargulisbacteria bacterium SCGC AG-410-N11]|nr:hypothetical protein DID75_05055 [Candidatus Marinamargulisbacteria bacterium SCGC AG-410-N11]
MRFLEYINLINPLLLQLKQKTRDLVFSLIEFEYSNLTNLKQKCLKMLIESESIPVVERNKLVGLECFKTGFDSHNFPKDTLESSKCKQELSEFRELDSIDNIKLLNLDSLQSNTFDFKEESGDQDLYLVKDLGQVISIQSADLFKGLSCNDFNYSNEFFYEFNFDRVLTSKETKQEQASSLLQDSNLTLKNVITDESLLEYTNQFDQLLSSSLNVDIVVPDSTDKFNAQDFQENLAAKYSKPNLGVQFCTMLWLRGILIQNTFFYKDRECGIYKQTGINIDTIVSYSPLLEEGEILCSHEDDLPAFSLELTLDYVKIKFQDKNDLVTGFIKKDYISTVNWNSLELESHSLDEVTNSLDGSLKLDDSFEESFISDFLMYFKLYINSTYNFFCVDDYSKGKFIYYFQNKIDNQRLNANIQLSSFYNDIDALSNFIYSKLNNDHLKFNVPIINGCYDLLFGCFVRSIIMSDFKFVDSITYFWDSSIFSEEFKYKVQQSESLSGIAQKFKISKNTIVSLNKVDISEKDNYLYPSSFTKEEFDTIWKSAAFSENIDSHLFLKLLIQNMVIKSREDRYYFCSDLEGKQFTVMSCLEQSGYFLRKDSFTTYLEKNENRFNQMLNHLKDENLIVMFNDKFITNYDFLMHRNLFNGVLRQHDFSEDEVLSIWQDFIILDSSWRLLYQSLLVCFNKNRFIKLPNYLRLSNLIEGLSYEDSKEWIKFQESNSVDVSDLNSINLKETVYSLINQSNLSDAGMLVLKEYFMIYDTFQKYNYSIKIIVFLKHIATLMQDSLENIILNRSGLGHSYFIQFMFDNLSAMDISYEDKDFCGSIGESLCDVISFWEKDNNLFLRGRVIFHLDDNGSRLEPADFISFSVMLNDDLLKSLNRVFVIDSQSFCNQKIIGN